MFKFKQFSTCWHVHEKIRRKSSFKSYNKRKNGDESKMLNSESGVEKKTFKNMYKMFVCESLTKWIESCANFQCIRLNIFIDINKYRALIPLLKSVCSNKPWCRLSKFIFICYENRLQKIYDYSYFCVYIINKHFLICFCFFTNFII